MLPGSAEWLLGRIVKAALNHTFSGISWTHAHLLPQSDRELLAGVDWSRVGAPKARLVVKPLLPTLPPQPLSAGKSQPTESLTNPARTSRK